MDEFNLRCTENAKVLKLPDHGWRLKIPPGEGGRYRLAQLDDYGRLSRSQFPWRAPLRLELQARASQADIPGTWGFGLWNDPFSLSLGLGGGSRRWPALPNAVWFFFASAHNYLSLRDDLPAHGNLAATFQSPRLPALALAAGIPGVALLAIPAFARLLRRLARHIIKEDGIAFQLDTTQWHHYELHWKDDQTSFHVDGALIHRSALTPNGPLGLVIWVDNQFAALPPDGKLRFGSLENPQPVWIEIREIEIVNG